MTEYRERAIDDVFFALSHRTRRRLLQQLASDRESRVTDVARRHRLSLPTVSKHIVVLERARLVRRRVRGREHYIRLEPQRLASAEQWLAHHRAFWTARLANLTTLMASRRARIE